MNNPIDNAYYTYTVYRNVTSNFAVRTLQEAARHCDAPLVTKVTRTATGSMRVSLGKVTPSHGLRTIVTMNYGSFRNWYEYLKFLAHVKKLRKDGTLIR